MCRHEVTLLEQTISELFSNLHVTSLCLSLSSHKMSFKYLRVSDTWRIVSILQNLFTLSSQISTTPTWEGGTLFQGSFPFDRVSRVEGQKFFTIICKRRQIKILYRLVFTRLSGACFHHILVTFMFSCRCNTQVNWKEYWIVIAETQWFSLDFRGWVINWRGYQQFYRTHLTSTATILRCHDYGFRIWPHQKTSSKRIPQDLFPGWVAGREKALASAGHMSILHPEILGVIN